MLMLMLMSMLILALVLVMSDAEDQISHHALDKARRNGGDEFYLGAGRHEVQGVIKIRCIRTR